MESKEILDNLIKEVAAVDGDMFSPKYRGDPANKDKEMHLVCIKDDPTLKALIALRQFYRREAETLEVQSRYEGNAEVRNADYARNDKLADLFNEMFWLILRERYHLWEKENSGLSLREGWNIVRDPRGPDDGDDPRSILKRMLGM